ncbi:MAG: hypothetical protein SNG38_05705 [Rikenellaceae bacterium]
MKKYIFILSAMLLTLSSCVKNELESNVTGEMSVKLQINTTSSVATRSDETIRYVVEAYYDETFTTPANVFENGYSSDVEVSANYVDMVISSSKEYYFLLWSDNGVSYDTEELKSVTLVEGEQMTEAWQGTFSIINGSETSYSATLKRAVGKVSLVELETFTASSLTVNFDSYNTFNVAIGANIGDVVPFEYVYEFEEAATGTLNEEEPIYVFAPLTYSNVIDFYFTAGGSSSEVTNTPVQANYITTISGSFYSSSLTENILNVGVSDVWGDDTVAEDDLITISSIDELMRYIQMDNVNAKMTPGTYYVTTEVATTYGRAVDPYQTPVTVFFFEGDNSTYDFEGVKFEVDTDILSALGSYKVYTYQVGGNNIHLKNLTSEFIGDSKPKNSATSMVVDGENNTIEGFTMTTRGSYPYGYGDLFGKGTNNTVSHYKHSGFLVRGTNILILNTTLYQYSYGHAFFCQGGINVEFKGCSAYAEMSNTDAVLAEAGTGTAADLVDFMTYFGYTVPAGYAISLCEAGFRAYNTGVVFNTGESRNTAYTYTTDCYTYQVRNGFHLHFSNNEKIIDNCTAVDCEGGFCIGSGQIYNSRGNSNNGPLIGTAYESDKNSYVEMEILPSENIYGLHDMLLYIGGTSHTYYFTEPEGTTEQDYHSQLEILVGGEARGLRYNNSENSDGNNYYAKTNYINNQTHHKIVIGANGSGNTVESIGEVTDYGTNNEIKGYIYDVNLTVE